MPNKIGGEFFVAGDMLISVSPRYWEMVRDGKKTAELRRTKPSAFPVRLFIYATAPVKKIVGVVRVEKVDVKTPREIGGLCGFASAALEENSGLTVQEMRNYWRGRSRLASFGSPATSAK